MIVAGRDVLETIGVGQLGNGTAACMSIDGHLHRSIRGRTVGLYAENVFGIGIKTGHGFYDYEGVDIEALKAKRDEQLFEVFRVAKKFMDDPV